VKLDKRKKQCMSQRIKNLKKMITFGGLEEPIFSSASKGEHQTF
jgi:hypothetical protein